MHSGGQTGYRGQNVVVSKKQQNNDQNPSGTLQWSAVPSGGSHNASATRRLSLWQRDDVIQVRHEWPTGCTGRSVARMCSSPIDFVSYCGLQNAICLKTTYIQRCISCGCQQSSARVLEEEIVTLLNKHAIRRVPNEEILQGFYSRSSFLKKKGSSPRPILDLCLLNRRLRRFTIRMLTHKAL